MVFGEIFSRFLKESPVAVMGCVLMERVLAPEKIDRIFTRTARRQNERDLLFSAVVDLMSEVVGGVRRSVNAAYEAKKKQKRITVSLRALYDKLQGVEERVNRALVRETVGELAEMVRPLGAECTPRVAGYRVKLLDGNALAKSEHGRTAAGQGSGGAGAGTGPAERGFLLWGWACAGAVAPAPGARDGGASGGIGGLPIATSARPAFSLLWMRRTPAL